MIETVVEFLFCPVHGIFSPMNWPVTCSVMRSVTSFVRRVL